MKQWLKKKMIDAVIKTKQTINNRRGEGFVDTAVKILMAAVIGGLVLAGHSVKLVGMARKLMKAG
ncbi:hypothetical protein PAE9249_04186 [Paenibacillus sp. CECT 9249]|uniref:DUF6133 family protein n=1 Tax=Paenibacillus sp. CECT 9249 TaxID=2845385 RepID=UPI001E4DEE81|nr:DUF6133 family protein [Paenibacillus sp. CECT 9249]CAH0121654.1 hypothetical protein PAE9249_04186 [Paenibacillus sp. CECT 9249]